MLRTPPAQPPRAAANLEQIPIIPTQAGSRCSLSPWGEGWGEGVFNSYRLRKKTPLIRPPSFGASRRAGLTRNNLLRHHI